MTSMDVKKDKSLLDRIDLRTLLALPLVMAAVAIILFLFAFSEYQISDNIVEWGLFGDYLGGVLSAVFSFFALVAFIISLHIQRTELYETRKVLKDQTSHLEQQRFESFFFSSLNLVIDSGRQTAFGGKYLGLAAFRHVYETELHSVAQASFQSDGGADIVALRRHYSAIYDDNISLVFGHFYRALYWIYKCIDAAPVTDDQKDVYAGLVRAQLSRHQLAGLFINGLSEEGEGFKRLLEKFEVFKNIGLRKFPWPHLLSAYESSAYGKRSVEEVLIEAGRVV